MADTYNAMRRDVEAMLRDAGAGIHSDFNACMFRDGCRKQADEITSLHDQLARAREFHAAELADMTAERDQLRQYLDAAQRRGEELRAQVAALEVDAGRYRWLRDKARSVDWTENINGWSWTQHCRIGGLSMDAAIDAALAARKGEA